MSFPMGISSITIPILAIGLFLILLWAIQRNHKKEPKQQ